MNNEDIQGKEKLKVLPFIEELFFVTSSNSIDCIYWEQTGNKVVLEIKGLQEYLKSTSNPFTVHTVEELIEMMENHGFKKLSSDIENAISMMENVLFLRGFKESLSYIKKVKNDKIGLAPEVATCSEQADKTNALLKAPDANKKKQTITNPTNYKFEETFEQWLSKKAPPSELQKRHKTPIKSGNDWSVEYNPTMRIRTAPIPLHLYGMNAKNPRLSNDIRAKKNTIDKKNVQPLEEEEKENMNKENA